MKSKHQGVFNLSVFGLSIALMLAYGIYQSNQIKNSIQMPSPAVVPQINIPEPATLAYINFLNGQLTDIARPKPSDIPVDLKLFEFPPRTQSHEKTIRKQTDAPGKGAQIIFSYQLTLSFASQTGSFCIIDGQLYKEKAALPDGGKILKIESDRVSILKQDRIAWIYQQSPSVNLTHQNQQAENQDKNKPPTESSMVKNPQTKNKEDQ